MFEYTLILAQVDAPPPPPAAAPEAAPQPGVTQAPNGETLPPAAAPTSPWGSLLLPIALLLIFWVLIFMPQRREKKRRAEMLSALRKGDRVQTIGGILGTVIDVREHEVIVKVDENNNTKLHMARAAIQAVLPEGKTAE